MNTSSHFMYLAQTTKFIDMRRVDVIQLIIYLVVEALLLIAKIYILVALSYYVKIRR